MAAIPVSILGIGNGTDTLTGKTDSEGLTIAFENEAPCFVSWKSFKQLLSFKTAQNGVKQKEVKAEPKVPPVPSAIPMTGAAKVS